MGNTSRKKASPDRKKSFPQFSFPGFLLRFSHETRIVSTVPAFEPVFQARFVKGSIFFRRKIRLDLAEVVQASRLLIGTTLWRTGNVAGDKLR